MANHRKIIERDIVELSELGPGLRSALVLATLAFPGLDEGEIRQKTFFRLSLRRFGLMSDELRAILPQLVQTESRNFNYVDGGQKVLQRVLRKKLDAGYLALQPILAAERGELPLRRRGRRWNQSSAVRAAAQHQGMQEQDFRKRIFTPSKPVIHIAAAWAGLLCHREKQGLGPDDLLRIATDLTFADVLLAEAQRFEALVDQSDLPVTSAELVKFRI